MHKIYCGSIFYYIPMRWVSFFFIIEEGYFVSFFFFTFINGFILGYSFFSRMLWSDILWILRMKFEYCRTSVQSYGPFTYYLLHKAAYWIPPTVFAFNRPYSPLTGRLFHFTCRIRPFSAVKALLGHLNIDFISLGKTKVRILPLTVRFRFITFRLLKYKIFVFFFFLSLKKLQNFE